MAAATPFRPWIYLGGAMGVSVILLCNLTVPKVSAYQLTVLTFVGQIFTGILLDLLIGNANQNTTFWGGLIIAFGIAWNYFLKYRRARKEQTEKEYRDRIKRVETEHRERVYKNDSSKKEGEKNDDT